MRTIYQYLVDHFGPQWRGFNDPLRPYIKRTIKNNQKLADSDQNFFAVNPTWRLNQALYDNRRGLDLCFWTCGMQRVMWLSSKGRYCFYWGRSNPRSKNFFSYETQITNGKVYF